MSSTSWPPRRTGPARKRPGRTRNTRPRRCCFTCSIAGYYDDCRQDSYALAAVRREGIRVSGGGARMLLPDPAPDGEIYLTTAQAAEAMGIKPPAVRCWVRIGYLAEAAPGWYAFSAVTAAEKLTRDAEARTRFQEAA